MPGKAHLSGCNCMQAHGPSLIALTGCMPDLVAPAWDYMRVRAWSMPPILYTLVGMVSSHTLWRILIAPLSAVRDHLACLPP